MWAPHLQTELVKKRRDTYRLFVSSLPGKDRWHALRSSLSLSFSLNSPQLTLTLKHTHTRSSFPRVSLRNTSFNRGCQFCWVCDYLITGRGPDCKMATTWTASIIKWLPWGLGQSQNVRRLQVKEPPTTKAAICEQVTPCGFIDDISKVLLKHFLL